MVRVWDVTEAGEDRRPGCDFELRTDTGVDATPTGVGRSTEKRRPISAFAERARLKAAIRHEAGSWLGASGKPLLLGAVLPCVLPALLPVLLIHLLGLLFVLLLVLLFVLLHS